MTAGARALLALGLTAVAVVGAFVRWSAWWPHSDNRQNGVTLFGIIAAVVGAVGLKKAAAAAPTVAVRVWMLVALVVAAALGSSVGYGLMVNATEWAK